MDAVYDSDASSDIYAPPEDTPHHVNQDTYQRNPVGQATESGGPRSPSLSSVESLASLHPNNNADEYNAPPPSKRRRLSQSPDLSPSSHVVKKSKMSSASPDNIYSEAVPPTASLPAEVWQHVFSFLPLDDLTRSLRVSTGFARYLTDLSDTMTSPASAARLHIVTSELVWTRSRETFSPKLPKPLPGNTEWSMLSMIGGSSCQQCQTASPERLLFAWAFGVRLCNDCFGTHSVKDIDLLRTNDSFLAPGLPFAFRSAANDYIPRHMSRRAQGAHISKVFYDRHIEEYRGIHDAALDQSEQDAKDWKAGLFEAGKTIMADVAEWELWHASLQSYTNPRAALREYFAPPIQYHPLGPSTGMPVNATQTQLLTHPLPSRPDLVPRFAQVNRYSLQPVPLNDFERMQEAKRLRRQAIEARCQVEFQPPLMPNVLLFMEAFNAAITIPQPLTDDSWALLKPGLEAQRDEAENRQYVWSQNIGYMDAIRQPAFTPNQSRNTQDRKDREIESQQAANRSEALRHMEAIVQINWKDGGLVTRRNTPNFIANVLSLTRESFYRNPAHSDKVLSLDTMKWVYEKLRLYVDLSTAHLFLCPEPDCDEGKWYAFEGIIQHYGAKHTTDFSKGNVVIHWPTAQWPEYPPFEPYPIKDQLLPEPDWTKIDRITSPNGSYTAKQQRSPAEKSTAMPSLVDTNSNGGLSFTDITGSSWDMSTGPMNKHHPDMLPLHTKAADLLLSEGGDQSNRRMAQKAVEKCNTISDILDLEISVKIKVFVQSIVDDYKSTHKNPPDLDTFAEILWHEPTAETIRNSSGLACNTCISSTLQLDRPIPSFLDRTMSAVHYSLSMLLDHFKDVHLEESSPYHWISDMIEVPEDSLLCGLIGRAYMNDEKLAIIANAFPGTFPNPLPTIGAVTYEAWAAAEELKLFRQANKIKPKGKKLTKKQRKALQKENEQHQMAAESEKEMPEAGEDEYDPRRPSTVVDVSNSRHRSRPTNTIPTSAPLSSANISFLASLMSGKQSAPIHQERSPSPYHPEAYDRHHPISSEEDHQVRSRRRHSGRVRRKNDIYTEPIPDVILADEAEPTPPRPEPVPYHPQFAAAQPTWTAPPPPLPYTAMESRPRSPPRFYDEYGRLIQVAAVEEMVPAPQYAYGYADPHQPLPPQQQQQAQGYQGYQPNSYQGYQPGSYQGYEPDSHQGYRRDY